MIATDCSAAPTKQRDTEFTFDASDFERVRKLIYERAGISLSSSKQAMVYSRLSRRLRDLGLRTFSVYLKELEHASGATADSEWQEFINCLTTNLTSFFREGHHFLILAAKLAQRDGKRTRIWCNAASTGEEPYSIAMTVLDTLGERADVEIVCSDIDTKVLARAQQGVYPLDSDGLGRERLRQHFLRGTGANSGTIRVKPALQRLVHFRSLNLMDAHWSLGEPFDIIFCRNVMIYFDAATQRRVLIGMHRALRQQGVLFAGHSENFTPSKDLFRLCGKTVYERL